MSPAIVEINTTNIRLSLFTTILKIGPESLVVPIIKPWMSRYPNLSYFLGVFIYSKSGLSILEFAFAVIVM